ncbi:MAG: protein kinase [Chloroflexi bacterium]|nr:protein kinase [Chloroflexota bacterium]
MAKFLTGKTLLNQYYVEEFIGPTPLGDRYRATDQRTNKALSLTLLVKTISDDPEMLKELEGTSKRLQSINHPNLTQYLGLFQTPVLAFILEDWVDGPTLKTILANTPVSITESLVYAKSICAGLDALHRRSYLHLNLSSELIQINQNGQILVSGMAFAKPAGGKVSNWLNTSFRHCFAPEQYGNQSLDTGADIYGLAVLLYMLVTARWINGKAPPSSLDAIRKVHLELPPPPPISINPSIPDHFSRMLLWALRKKPEDRFKTTTELLSSLLLAARIGENEIPDLADPKTAPVTSAILAAWQYLPTPKPDLLSKDLPPLEDRLLAINSRPQEKIRRRPGIIQVISLLVLAGFLSLFWLVKPVEVSISAPPKFTPFAADYTPPPTFTPLPKPTDPNGGRIAFTCTRGDYNQLCMINRDGTGLSQLTDMQASNYYPVFSPDGGSLLFSSNRNGSFDLYLLLFSEKQLFQITNQVGNVISPDYSPDGRKIVFANRAADGPTSIWMVNADGVNPHLVYAGPDTVVATAWSPNGERIAYAMSVGIPQEYEIFTMDINGRNHIRLSEGLQGIGGSIDWSPDGTNLLIHAGPSDSKDIYKLDVNTGTAVQITHGGNNAGASYSPDGKYIVFNSLRNNDQADLYIMRSNGDNQVQLTNDPEPDWGAQWVQ